MDSLGRSLVIMCVSVFRRLVPIGVVRVPGCGHGYPQPGLLSYISTVCSADHIPLLPLVLLLSRPALSLCWLSAPNFPSMARASTPVYDACGQWLLLPFDILLQSTIDCYNSTFDTFDPPPLPSLIPLSVRLSPACRIVWIRVS